MLNLVGDIMVDIFEQQMMVSLLMRNIEASNQSDRFLDALTRRLTGLQSLITHRKAHVNRKRQMNTTDEEHCVVQRLKKKFLVATYHPRRQCQT